MGGDDLRRTDTALNSNPGSADDDKTKDPEPRKKAHKAGDSGSSPVKSPKRSTRHLDPDNDDVDEEPVKKRSRCSGPDKRIQASPISSKPSSKMQGTNEATEILNKPASSSKSFKDVGSKVDHNKFKETDRKKLRPHAESAKLIKGARDDTSADPDDAELNRALSHAGNEEAESEDEETPEVAAKAREKVQTALKSSGKDPYPDWKQGDPVPYAALCTTFSLIEMTTKRLIISSHCSLFLRQVLRLTPQDLLPTVLLMINKLAADYAGVELGIGESLIMKAIGETTGRSLQIIKADQAEIGDLGLVAAKSRSSQPTMFKPKALTVKGVLDGLMGIATVSGDGSQGRKVAGIKKLLSSADVALAGKGGKGVDITKDKGGASETKFIIRFLEGKLRLGLAEKTVLVALAHAMVIHETERKGNRLPNSEQLAKGEAILKTVYR